MKKLLLFAAAVLCLVGCNQNEPSYDKVAGHTYVSQYGPTYEVDTIIFLKDGSLKSIWPNAEYQQIDQIVVIDTHNGLLYFEAFNKRIVNWDKRYYYDRMD